MKAILFLTLALVGLDTNVWSAKNILPDASERSKTFTYRGTSIIHQNNLIGDSMKQGNNLSHIANDSFVGHFHVSNHHLMLMAGFGTPDATPDFSSLGVGYEYRLPFWDRKFGIGCMAMFMKYENYSHFMPLGTGTLHPYKNWFLQGEIGMAHDKSSEGVHKMATSCRNWCRLSFYYWYYCYCSNAQCRIFPNTKTHLFILALYQSS